MAEDVEIAPIDDPDGVDEADHIVHLREVFGTEDDTPGVQAIDEQMYEYDEQIYDDKNLRR
jgi:hypothetical protein